MGLTPSGFEVGFEAKKGNPLATFLVPLLRRSLPLRILSTPLLFVTLIVVTLAALSRGESQSGLYIR